MTEDTPWLSASTAPDGPDRVQARHHDGFIELRDGNDPDGTVLRFTPGEWRAFLDGARKREFDHLVADHLPQD